MQPAPLGNYTFVKTKALFGHSGWWPEIAVLVLGVGAAILFHGMPVSHDVVWQMWLARQIAHGVELYADIIEINPPLWFWLGASVQAVAEYFALKPVQVLVGGVFFYAGIALALIAWLIRAQAPVCRAVILLTALMAMVVLPISDFGQREHLALIGALPYVFVMARRRQGQALPIPLAFLVGLAAALGFALKHYFLLVPVFLELWLVAALGKSWRPMRPETLALLAAAALYAAAVALFTPAFFTVTAPMVALAYSGYDMSLQWLFFTPWALIWALGLVGIFSLRHSLPPLAVAALLAFLGFALAYFLQQKGWRYHGLPASGSLALATAAIMVSWKRPLRQAARHPAVIAVGLLLLLFAGQGGAYSNPFKAAMRQAMGGAKPGDVVMVFSAHASLAWPMVDNAGFIWPSRYFTFWMLPAIARGTSPEKSPDPGMRSLADRFQELARSVRAQTRKDLFCHPPRLIIVDDGGRGGAAPGGGFSIFEFFKQDPGLKSLFSHYRRTGTVDRFTTYVLADDWRPPVPADCRIIY
ncbi:MAG: hypothetical protein ACOY99_06905 [Pseudomonadota bacterium]